MDQNRNNGMIEIIECINHVNGLGGKAFHQSNYHTQKEYCKTATDAEQP